MTDQTCQKWFVKFCAGDFSLDNAPQQGRPIEVDSNQTETLRSTFYQMGDSQCTQSTQINKVTGENEKYVFYFKEKNHMDLLTNAICQLGFVSK